MGEMPHRSRREILQSISILGSGSLLLPLGVLNGALLDDRPRGTIRGVLRDGASGKPVAAKMRVSNSGEAFMPAPAIKTMPQRTRASVKHYFYARGSYEIAVPPGRYDIEVVRGICHEAVMSAVEVGAGLTGVLSCCQWVPGLMSKRDSMWQHPIARLADRAGGAWEGRPGSFSRNCNTATDTSVLLVPYCSHRVD